MAKKGFDWDSVYAEGRRLFAEGLTSGEVAEALGVTKGGLETRIARDRMAGKYWRPHTPRPTGEKQAPIRHAPDPRSLTGRLLGDPLPGRSAADKREAPKPAPSMGWW